MLVEDIIKLLFMNQNPRVPIRFPIKAVRH